MMGKRVRSDNEDDDNNEGDCGGAAETDFDGDDKAIERTHGGHFLNCRFPCPKPHIGANFLQTPVTQQYLIGFQPKKYTFSTQ